MNVCNEKHEPAFKIKYKGASGSDYQPEWLVCEFCHEKKQFGTLEDIVSIEPIR